jgi:hypothetical protein
VGVSKLLRLVLVLSVNRGVRTWLLDLGGHLDDAGCAACGRGGVVADGLDGAGSAGSDAGEHVCVCVCVCVGCEVVFVLNGRVNVVFKDGVNAG